MMSGEIPTPAWELEHLKQRVGKLAEDKSHLQLIIHMMRRLNTVPGLKKTVENLLNTLLDNIGGTNITVYYSMNGGFHKTDMLGNDLDIPEIDNGFARTAFNTKEISEEERDIVPSEGASPSLSEGFNWAYPLLVGPEIIGVVAIEGVYSRLRNLHGVLPTFFNYAALILKNEIFGFTQLQDAYQKVSSAYDQLKQAHAQLLQRDKMASIGQLAAGIAHEINTPAQFLSDNTVFLSDALKDVLTFLTALRGECDGDRPSNSSSLPLKERLEALDLDYLIEEIPRALQQSREGVNRVTAIVSAMKDFSHPGAEGKTLVDLNQAIESTILVSRNEWKYFASLETDLDPALPPVPCFLGEFNQVILNLLVNAAHAIRDFQAGQDAGSRGRIRISTRRNAGQVEIQISDTGIGIPENIQSRIFEPFFTTKEVGKGTGLGLSIAYDIIVNKHGGDIRVSSEAGKGSTFVLSLPLIIK